MNGKHWLWMVAAATLAAGCGEAGGNGEPGSDESADRPAASAEPGAGPGAGATEIVPGLTMHVLEEGSGETAEPGDTAVVHYTGWLHDPSAPDNRGSKFDSSRDRGQPFEFTIGAGQVIRGWDEGVRGMQVGEIRELTIAPHLGYGERGVGPIPPNATLLFEVELLDVKPASAGE